MKTIPIFNSHLVAIVDDNDYDGLAIFRWCLHPSGYAIRGSGSAKIYMHRQIMNFPANLVDHRDHNVLNNSRSNLRCVTAAQNVHHTTPRHRRTKRALSRFLGVSWDKARRKWKAYVCVNYSTKWIGRFNSEVEAAKARDQEAIKLHGAFAALNFPIAQ